eukprot:TRINITY_DN7619_c0_g1_i1.p1 TRINITY_DN7619_c0_g1~~TRINITY_DN7619_c0_g1_i1.p1  ORF type:complete len:205 (-),score=24.82 TRINITY_DN7619_c0_g1_i1:122-736(-)
MGLTTLNNNIFVCDSDNQRIQLFDLAGRHISTTGNSTFKGPWGIATSPDQTLVITDPCNNAVIGCTTTGRTLYSLSGKRSSFSNPRGVVVSKRSDKIFVSDWGNHRIQVFSLKNRLFMYSIGNRTSFFGKSVTLDFPAGLCLDSDGNLYVASSWSNEIVVLDQNGTKLSSFGSECLKCPFDVTVNEEGFVYVCDRKNHRILVYT